MKTITELRDDLLKTFVGLRDGSIDCKVAAEMNNTAGKVINTVRAQLEYAELRQEKPEIPFMS